MFCCVPMHRNCMGDLPRGFVLIYTIKMYGRNCVPNLNRLRSETALKLFWQLLANVLFAGTYGYWQQMKTTEDLEGLNFS